MESLLSQSVLLKLRDPDAGQGRKGPPPTFPTVSGKLSRKIVGFHKIAWYIIKLDNDLPADFDPLDALSDTYNRHVIQWLVFIPTAIPYNDSRVRDAIVDAHALGQIVHGTVCVIRDPRVLPDELTNFNRELRTISPVICSAILEFE